MVNELDASSCLRTTSGSVVTRSFKKRGVNVQENVRITGIEGARELTVSWNGDSGAQSVVVDKVIVSISQGRRRRTG